VGKQQLKGRDKGGPQAAEKLMRRGNVFQDADGTNAD
jgi:hypothetical protein